MHNVLFHQPRLRALLAWSALLLLPAAGAHTLFLQEAPNDYSTLSESGRVAGPGGPITTLFEEGTTDYDGTHATYAATPAARGEVVEFAVFEPSGPTHPWDIVPLD